MEQLQVDGLSEQRRHAAELAYSSYDFHGVVEASNGWESSGDELTRVIFMAPDQYIESSERCVFNVRFREDSAEVAEVYAISSQGVIFGEA